MLNSYDRGALLILALTGLILLFFQSKPKRVLLIAHGRNCCQVVRSLRDVTPTVAYWVERLRDKSLTRLHKALDGLRKLARAIDSPD
jgi:hypothetical protein